MPPLANLSDAACSILTIMFAFNTLLGDGSTNSIPTLMLLLGHSGEYGNGAKLVGKMSKSVMQLISINF